MDAERGALAGMVMLGCFSPPFLVADDFCNDNLFPELPRRDSLLLGGVAGPASSSRRRRRRPRRGAGAVSGDSERHRQAANQRERRRMESINAAFEGLRAHIPTLPYERRLSKVDTLRLAIGYIAFLGEMVRGAERPTRAEETRGAAHHGHGRKVVISHRAARAALAVPVPGSLTKRLLFCLHAGAPSAGGELATSHDKGLPAVAGRAVGACPGSPPLSGHSLSWSDERQRRGQQVVRTGRVWTPEDPHGGPATPGSPRLG
ncbi:pancreas transcription factor 1 subunit alpha-like [Lampetra planeri]